MTQRLKFYDEGHIYEYRNQVIPSVSEILRFMSREVYGEIDKYILDHAAERGTAVHKAAVELDLHGTVECDEEIFGYCAERGNNVDAQRFVDFYTSNGWLVGKNHMKDWKAAVRTWEQRNGKKDDEKPRSTYQCPTRL